MTRWNNTLVLLLVVTSLLGAVKPTAAQYAAAVVSYSAGTTPFPGYTTASAALGGLAVYRRGRVSGRCVAVRSPFLSSEVVSVGEGGQITLQLSHYAIPQAAGPEIGVFENIGIIDTDYPNGHAGSPTATFGPLDSAVVEVTPTTSTG